MAILKPEILRTATDPTALQKAMLADLKARTGKHNVKFIAAKNCPVGSRLVSLFIVTDTPNLFEVVIKTRFPKAYRVKGTCDVVKGEQSGQLEVAIRTAAGQMTPTAVAALVKPALGSGSTVQASFQPSGTSAALKTVAKPAEGGVPDWAKEAYKSESKVVVLASMTPDKKIGSVYFEGEGRIRTTHATGPKSSKHERTVQFNIDTALARAAFVRAHVHKMGKLKSWPTDRYNEWIKKKLGEATATRLPVWAKMVTTPQTGFDLGPSGAPPGGYKLIEIFKDINGNVASWHPSRGVAARFETDTQTISVLRAALKHINDLNLTDANERNEAFYEFVKRRLPRFIQYLREPSEV